MLVPVLDRPERAAIVTASLRATTDAQLVFLVSPGDVGEREAIERVRRRERDVSMLVVRFPPGPGDYARKINLGVEVTSAEWLFQGADDLRFHDGWLDRALAAAEDGHRVIGTNDLCNPRCISGRHSTHSLVHRSYVEGVGTVDEPGKMLCEQYGHNFCDDELVGTAQFRGEFRHARTSVVEHLHPNCGEIAMDATYVRGLEPKQFASDRVLFHQRRASVFGKRPVAGRHAR